MLTQAVHVILNPTSGGGRAGRLAGEIARELQARNIDATMLASERPGHPRELARSAAQAGAYMVVAAGGDGTIHDVANGLLESGTSVPMAVIPAGTGNDFAKLIRGAESRRSAYDTIAQPTFHAYDVGKAQWSGGSEFFVNGMGMGIDVEVVRQILRLPAWPGPVKYLAGLLRALAVYEPLTLRAEFDTETLESSIMMFAIGNGVCQGGGFYLTPDAAPDDGLLDMCVVRQLPHWRVPLVLPLVLRGTHTRNAAVTMRRSTQVRFESVGGRALFFQLDGELREPAGASWLQVDVHARALRVATRGR